jgi:hypothetical protein
VLVTYSVHINLIHDDGGMSDYASSENLPLHELTDFIANVLRPASTGAAFDLTIIKGDKR